LNELKLGVGTKRVQKKTYRHCSIREITKKRHGCGSPLCPPYKDGVKRQIGVLTWEQQGGDRTRGRKTDIWGHRRTVNRGGRCGFVI